MLVNHLVLVLMKPWLSSIGSDVAWLSGIGSDDVLTPDNFQAYTEFSSHFYTQAPGSCVLGCKYQESRKIVSLLIIGPTQLPFHSTEI